MSADWFYLSQGSPKGPFTLEGLKGLIASGVVMSNDAVWTESLGEWTAAWRVPALARPSTRAPLQELNAGPSRFPGPPPFRAAPPFQGGPSPRREMPQDALEGLAAAASPAHAPPAGVRPAPKKASPLLWYAVAGGVCAGAVVTWVVVSSGRGGGSAANGPVSAASAAPVPAGAASSSGAVAFEGTTLQVYYLPPVSERTAKAAADVLRRLNFVGGVQIRDVDGEYELHYRQVKGEGMQAAVRKLDAVIPELRRRVLTDKPTAIHLCENGFQTAFIVPVKEDDVVPEPGPVTRAPAGGAGADEDRRLRARLRTLVVERARRKWRRTPGSAAPTR